VLVRRKGFVLMPTDIALLIVRVVVGLLMFVHGAQKLFGWFGGHGLTATSTMAATHARLRPANLWTLGGARREAGGGLWFALALLHPRPLLAPPITDRLRTQHESNQRRRQRRIPCLRDATRRRFALPRQPGNVHISSYLHELIVGSIS